MAQPTNHAALLPAKNAPISIRQTPYPPPPGPHELTIQTAAVAINPYDHIIQSAPSLAVPWTTLPFPLGTDVAGTVLAVGASVTRFAVGDRVVAHAAGLDKRVNRAVEGGFQEYVLLRENMTSRIPAGMAMERAAVLPLGLSTAACGLFMGEFLGLGMPRAEREERAGEKGAKKKVLLVWGASTSVGCNAVQLGVAAGVEVVATAGRANFGLVKGLGAKEVFDYRAENVVRDLLRVLEGREVVGAISIGRGSLAKCADVLEKCQGRKFIAQATLDVPPFPKGAMDFPGFVFGALRVVMGEKLRLWRKGVSAKMINGSDLVANEVGKAIYQDFLPRALELGTFVPAPEPRVMGRGLDSVQGAMDLSKKGVSARKLVVLL